MALIRVRIRVLGVAAAALLAVAVIAALTVDASPDGEQRVAAGGGTTTTWEEETTTTTAAPPTTAAPTTTAAPAPRPPRAAKAKAAPKAPSAGSSRTLGPRPPGSAVFGYTPGRSEWSATSNGIAMSIRMEPAAPRTGDLVRFFLTASSARICCGLYMVYGDGFTSGSSGCGTQPGAASTELTHGYNKAGQWEFLFQASDGACGDHMQHGAIYGWIEVAPGTTTSQGPSQPTLQIGDNNLQAGYSNDDRSYVTVAGTARDEDGYIARFVVDWGDGSPTEQLPGGDGAGCRPTSSGWPAPSMGNMPTNPPATHRYAARGTYAVTVTAYSTGCDGRDEQHVTKSFDWTY